MVTAIELTSDSMVLQVDRRDGLCGMNVSLELPLRHVCGATRADGEARRWLAVMRPIGTNFPNVLNCGRLHVFEHLLFWNVFHAKNAIRIDVRDPRFDSIVVEVADPETEIARVLSIAGRPVRVSA